MPRSILMNLGVQPAEIVNCKHAYALASQLGCRWHGYCDRQLIFMCMMLTHSSCLQLMTSRPRRLPLLLCLRRLPPARHPQRARRHPLARRRRSTPSLSPLRPRRAASCRALMSSTLSVCLVSAVQCMVLSLRAVNRGDRISAFWLAHTCMAMLSYGLVHGCLLTDLRAGGLGCKHVHCQHFSSQLPYAADRSVRLAVSDIKAKKTPPPLSSPPPPSPPPPSPSPPPPKASSPPCVPALASDLHGASGACSRCM